MVDNSSGSHVRFNPEHNSRQTEEIAVAPGLDGESVDVHLGFLQCQHVYEVTVPILHQLGPGVTCEGQKYIRLTGSEPRDSVEHFVFELFAHAEGIMLATVQLAGKNGERSLVVRFHARVLGKLMGTPALKNGIKSVGIRVEDDASDEEMSDSEL